MEPPAPEPALAAELSQLGEDLLLLVGPAARRVDRHDL